MDITQIRVNLKRLEDNGAVTRAYFLMAGYGQIRAFVKLIIPPPYSAEREQELTRMARDATGLPNNSRLHRIC